MRAPTVTVIALVAFVAFVVNAQAGSTLQALLYPSSNYNGGSVSVSGANATCIPLNKGLAGAMKSVDSILLMKGKDVVSNACVRDAVCASVRLFSDARCKTQVLSGIDGVASKPLNDLNLKVKPLSMMIVVWLVPPPQRVVTPPPVTRTVTNVQRATLPPKSTVTLTSTTFVKPTGTPAVNEAVAFDENPQMFALLFSEPGMSGAQSSVMGFPSENCINLPANFTMQSVRLLTQTTSGDYVPCRISVASTSRQYSCSIATFFENADCEQTSFVGFWGNTMSNANYYDTFTNGKSVRSVRFQRWAFDANKIYI
jgi:hypothetical protein